MNELLARVDELFRSLGPAASQREGSEWYLGNNLRTYRAALEKATTRTEVENATHALGRFCTDSLDWGSREFKACDEIVRLGSKIAKTMPG